MVFSAMLPRESRRVWILSVNVIQFVVFVCIETFSSPILKQLTDALPESQHLMVKVEQNVATFARELEALILKEEE